MIADYLKQTATLERVVPTTIGGVVVPATDLYGETTWGTATTILCRKRKATSIRLVGHLEELNIQAIFHTTVIVAKGDKVDGVVVQAISELVNYAGVIIGTVVYT